MDSNNPICGHCLCGAVAYEYRGTVGLANYCHCEDCRRCTGSAFNVGVRFELEKFRLTRGTVKGFTKRADSGNELTRFFCPECGSPLYTASPAHPRHVFVKAGTLDDPSVVEPQRQTWLSSAVPWRHIDPAIASFPRGPA